MSIQESNVTPAAPEFQLGVLLVHGIGVKRSGDTLVRWGDVLLKTIGLATQPKVVTTVERAGPGGDSRWKGRLEAVVRLRAGNHTERWLVREGWWADAFPAPSYRELVSWSVRALPWSIVTHIAERYWQEPSSGPWGRGMLALVRVLLQLIPTLLLAPVLIGVLGLLLLLGLLPIPQIRTLILAVQSTLTATVGDSLAFVESPVRAALIRTCILDGLERLKPLCQHTVIVAHSQGAAVVLDALGGIVEGDNQRQAQAALRLVPDALVTFGAGTNQLASQKVLAAGVPNTRGINPVFAAVLALLGAAGSLLWLYLSVRLHQTTIGNIGWGLLLLLLVWMGASLFLVLIGALIARRPASKLALGIGVGTASAISMAGFGFLFWYSDRADLPMFPLILLVITVVFTAGSISLILSSDMEKIVTAPVRTPPGLDRWIDLYASADPVPNGRTRANDDTDAKCKSVKIWNLGSPFADHTAYWDNRDGFVLRVVRVCAETAHSPWMGALPGESDFVDTRAAWRVGFLRIARWSTSLTWLVLGALLWFRHQASLPVPFDLPGWLPAAPVRLALFAALIALAMWATSRAHRWLWSWWVHAEQEAVLAHGQPGGKEQVSHQVVPFCMALVVWTLIVAAFFLSKIDSWAALEASLTDRNALEQPRVNILVLAFVSTLALLKLKGSPKPHGSSEGGSIP